MTNTISGHVLDHEASQRLSDLRIEAWDASLNLSQPVAITFTDGQGTFQMHLDEAYLQGHFSQQQPELYFKVWRGDALLTDTQYALTWRLGDAPKELVIELNASVDPDATVTLPSRSALSLTAQGARAAPATGHEAAFPTPSNDLAVPVPGTNAQSTIPLTGGQPNTQSTAPAPAAQTANEVGLDPTVTLQIDSPANNAALIGHVPVQVTISGTMKVVTQQVVVGTYIFGANNDTTTVTVQIGSAQPQMATISGSLESRNGGTLTWTCPATLPANKQSIQVKVHGSLYWNFYIAAAKFGGVALSDASPITIQFNSVVSIDVQSPQDGQVFVGANNGVTITATGTASSDALLDHLECRLDGVTVAKILYDINVGGALWNWKVPPITLALGPHTLVFTVYDTNGHSQSQQLQVQVGLAQDIFGVDARSYLGALVEFATRPFQGSMARITTDTMMQHNLTFDVIDSTFHQSIALILDPDNQVPSTEPVNPARICIEVLRKYLQAHPPSNAQQSALLQKELSYLNAAYQLLLQQIGTSFDEIRMARTYRQNPTDQPRLQAIADRLGLQLLTPRPDELDDLFLDLGAAGSLSENALEHLENALEQLFGFVDTRRDPFSQGATAGDANGQIVRWHLDGLNFTNTDGDGYVYLTLAQAAGPKYSVRIFADAALTRELAQGDTSNASGKVTLVSAHNSGVSGTVTISYHADTTAPITLYAFPRLLAWRRRRLRSNWALESWRLSQGPVVADEKNQIVRWNLAGVSLVKNTDTNGFVYLTLKQHSGPSYELDVYSDQARTHLIASGSTPNPRGTLTLAPANASGVSGTITLDYQADTAHIALSMVLASPPAVDPDLLTDADFTSPLDTNPAYQLYQQRKMTVNTTWFGGLKAQREGAANQISGLNAILGSVLTDPQYYPHGMTIADVITLDGDRHNGADISQTLSALSLEGQAFNRLVRVCTFVNAGQSLLDWEWDEVYSILVQVMKKRAAFAWVAEEQRNNILVSPDYFIFPPKLPQLFSTGLDASGLPLGDGATDPHWKIISTPSGSAPLPAYATISAANSWPIGQAWLRNSSVSRWISPQADESTGDPPGLYTYRTTIDLDGYDPASVWVIAKIAVDNELTGVRLNGTDLALNASGYASFTTIEITGAFQRGANTLDFIVKNDGTSANPSGLRVELSFGTPPVFSSLPAWRATDAARHTWDALLQGRIDQDVSLARDLQRAVDATEKRVLPRLKNALLAAGSVSTTLSAPHSTGKHFARYHAWFFDLDWMITGVHAGQTDMAFIPLPPNHAWMPKDDVSYWIAPSPFEDSGPGDPPGTYTFHTSFNLTGIDVSGAQLVLNIAVADAVSDVLLNGHSLGWTANSATAFKTLSIASGFVAGTNTLDVVVTNGQHPGPCGVRIAIVTATATLFVTPEWLSSALLIDVKAASDRATTRLEQATQLMQSLFFALRNRQFEHMSPQPGVASWLLTETPGQFDEEWATMGSYASWNGLMLVFLYPENTLLPDLRLLAASPSGEPQAAWEKTKEFADFASTLSSASPLTPPLAVKHANDYLANLNAAKYPDLPGELKSGGQYKDPRDVDFAALVAWAQPVMDNYVKNGNWIAVAFLWEAWYSVAVQIGLELQKAQQFEAALAWFGSVYAYTVPLLQSGTGWIDDQRKYFPGLLHERTDSQYLQVPTWTITAPTPHQVAVTRAFPYTRFMNLTIIDCLLDFADAQFTSFTTESISEARGLYLQSLDLLAQLEAIWPANPVLQPNPRLAALRLHAENNLAKLRAGRNIAGLLAPAASSDSLLPSAYRYAALIDRAKQIVALAQQAEGAFLIAMEKEANEAYTALKAKQDLDSAQAVVTLETLKVTQANDGVSLAKDQVNRSRVQVGHYIDLLDSDIVDLERASMGLQYVMAPINLFGAIASGLNAQTSLEEKQIDWEAGLQMAMDDENIAQDQVNVANDTVAIAAQDQANAKAQADHAQATVDFLATKFTNKALYRWMSGVLGGVYSSFLRQATAVARLAQSQLAFERQEKVPSIIRSDYWQPLSAAPAQPTDTRGLTGADQLLADITQLDQFAFNTDQRRLQLTKVISLARLDPVAFQHFTQSGVLRFATPMALFDRDFPGHYVRLIKQVRVSVVALVPPNQGIRATLANTGVSRVIIIDDAGNFGPVVVRRDPQLIALSSPTNATGIFDLAAQPTMLLPFEGLGVDTSWELIMPRASNPFDFSTIADVLLTIDYTALDSPDYRQQVIRQLDPSMSADQAYSFRYQFADQWYELHHPQQFDTPMVVTFATERNDFPPNLTDGPTIRQVVLYFVPNAGQPFEISSVSLHFGAGIGGTANTINDITSTRGGNPAAWAPMIGEPAAQQWTLDLSGSSVMGPEPSLTIQDVFAKEYVADILFVITYEGTLPPWPS